jgi:hopanoid biosynthesis associated protein HpnK
MRRLIVNADDFGLTSGVNRAILEAHGHGILTSATLMANARATSEAVTMAVSAHALSVGCHIVLVDGEPLAANVPSLTVEAKTMRDGVGELMFATLTRNVEMDEVYREAAAQIAKLVSSGLTLSHLDSHKHTHMVPRITDAIMRAASDAGIRAIRNPFEPAWSLQAARAAGGKFRLRAFEVSLLAALRPRFERSARRFGMKVPDGTFGIALTGFMSRERLTNLIDAMPEGTWELVCHPGYNDAELGRVGTRLRASRFEELELLTGAEIRQALESHGVQLISYREL